MWVCVCRRQKLWQKIFVGNPLFSMERQAKDRYLIIRTITYILCFHWWDEMEILMVGCRTLQIRQIYTGRFISFRTYVCVRAVSIPVIGRESVWVPVIGCITSYLPQWHKGYCCISKRSGARWEEKSWYIDHQKTKHTARRYLKRRPVVTSYAGRALATLLGRL